VSPVRAGPIQFNRKVLFAAAPKSGNIPARKDEIRIHGSYEVSSDAYAVASGNRTSAA